MHVLDERKQFPIMAWIGPSGNQITRQSMATLADCGFNLSLSMAGYDNDGFAGDWHKERPLDLKILTHQLDCAHAQGIRLVIALPGLCLTQGIVDDVWRKKMQTVIDTVKHHPGLYGYYTGDEPKVNMFDDMAKAFAYIQEHDPDHLCYLNHWTVGQCWAGLRSYEDMWDNYIGRCHPRMISADLYPFSRLTEEEWLAEKDSNPLVAKHHKGRTNVHFFEMHGIIRQYSRINRIAAWNFTNSNAEHAEETVEGEMRFQLMMALAYGCTGLQYFTYSLFDHLVGADQTPTPRWSIAQRINRKIRQWEKTLLNCRNIGVYHYPHNFPYTRPLDNFALGSSTDLFARGDAIVLGHFVDANDWEYALIVNRNPFDSAVSIFHFGTDDGAQECIGPDEWGPLSKKRTDRIRLAPGDGRLFRFRRTITIS